MAQRCEANAKSTGEQCARYAIEGGRTCRVHGSATSRAKAAAARRVAEDRAIKDVQLFGARRDIDPGAALIELVQWTAGEVEFWRERVRALAAQDPGALTWGTTKEVEKGSGADPGTDTTQEAKPNIVYAMLISASDRLAIYSERALKAGVAERAVRLAEATGNQFVALVRRILDALFVALLAAGLTHEQLGDAWAKAVAEIVPRELRAIAGGQA